MAYKCDLMRSDLGIFLYILNSFYIDGTDEYMTSSGREKERDFSW